MVSLKLIAIAMEDRLRFTESLTLNYSDSVLDALDDLAECFLLTDPAIAGHPIVFASRGFLSISGYSSDEVVGRNGRIFQGPATDRRSVMEIREAIRGERTVQISLLNYRKDGSPHWILFYLSPVVVEGRVIHFLAVQVPIAARRSRGKTRAAMAAAFGACRDEVREEGFEFRCEGLMDSFEDVDNRGMERGESSRPKRSQRERPTTSNRARRLRNEPSQLSEPIPEQMPKSLIEASLTTPIQQATQTRTIVTQSAQAPGIEEEEEEDEIQQFPGGPIDISLLKGFKTHVAFEIWQGKEREPLKCMSKTYTLLEWKWWVRKDNETFRGYIMQSGLYPLIKCSYRTVDKILVSALVERWQPETNTFHMPFGEMSISLDDVFNILGIPITGSSVSPMTDCDDLSSMDMLKKYLGVGNVKATEALVGFGGEYVRLEWLRSNFEKVSDSDTLEVIECAARAYLLYLVGCTIFTDKSGTRVNLQYLKFFTVLENVSNYAWGSGCLAWLYRQLGYASRAGVKQIGGYLTLLQAWVYEHMYNLVKPDYDLKYKEEYPRACRWVPRRDSGTSADDIQRLRLCFDMSKGNEVVWDPYTSRRDIHPLNGIASTPECSNVVMLLSLIVLIGY